MMEPVVLSQHVGATVNGIVSNLIAFLPRLVWTVMLVAVGFGVAIFASSRVEAAVEGSPHLADDLAPTAGLLSKWLLLFFAATIALSELGLNTGVLVVFIDGVAFGLGVTVALLVGAAVWGGRDYVADHAEELFDAVTADGGAEAAADGGEE
jgi:hypothetical protein